MERKRDQLLFTVSLINDEQMKKLNAKHRGIKHSTDVLSFEIKERLPKGEWLGEVVVSKNYAKRQARELRHSFEEEVAFLVAHGVMHLLGIHHKGDELQTQKSKLRIQI